MPGLRSPRLRWTLCAAGLALAGSLLLVGCKQADGERCQLDSDCASGLCVIRTGSSMGLPEGTCEEPGQIGGFEASVPREAGVAHEAGKAEATPREAAATPEAPAPDSKLPDASLPQDVSVE